MTMWKEILKASIVEAVDEVRKQEYILERNSKYDKLRIKEGALFEKFSDLKDKENLAYDKVCNQMTEDGNLPNIYIARDSIFGVSWKSNIKDKYINRIIEDLTLSYTEIPALNSVIRKIMNKKLNSFTKKEFGIVNIRIKINRLRTQLYSVQEDIQILEMPLNEAKDKLYELKELNKKSISTIRAYFSKIEQTEMIKSKEFEKRIERIFEK